MELYCLHSVIFLCRPFVVLLGGDINTAAKNNRIYELAVVCGAIPTILNVVMGYMVRAEGASLHASIGTMSGCILNMILDPFFILPWGLGMECKEVQVWQLFYQTVLHAVTFLSFLW